jgi:hypothetical protein
MDWKASDLPGLSASAACLSAAIPLVQSLASASLQRQKYSVAGSAVWKSASHVVETWRAERAYCTVK